MSEDQPISELPVSEIRVKLTHDPRNKLRAYCSVTFGDAFVVRDLKIIDGAKGPFLAMPSRKLADSCPRCRSKNHLRARFCNHCGGALDPERAPSDHRGRARLHADLAHPVNSATRIELHRLIVQAYNDEIERSLAEGYQPPSFDDLDTLSEGVDEEYLDELARRQEVRARRREEQERQEPAAEGAGNEREQGA